MDIWVITDTHFGHDKIKDYCGRPDDFITKTLTNLASINSGSNVLIHLGDVCIGNDSYWNGSLRYILKGKMWLVRGNHDRKSFSWYMDQGWDCVADKIELSMYGKRLWLSYKPIKDPPEDVLNIHGHHRNVPHHPEDWWVSDQHKFVFMEHHYQPVKLRSLVE